MKDKHAIMYETCILVYNVALTRGMKGTHTVPGDVLAIVQNRGVTLAAKRDKADTPRSDDPCSAVRGAGGRRKRLPSEYTVRGVAARTREHGLVAKSPRLKQQKTQAKIRKLIPHLRLELLKLKF